MICITQIYAIDLNTPFCCWFSQLLSIELHTNTFIILQFLCIVFVMTINCMKIQSLIHLFERQLKMSFDR